MGPTEFIKQTAKKTLAPRIYSHNYTYKYPSDNNSMHTIVCTLRKTNYDKQNVPIAFMNYCLVNQSDFAGEWFFKLSNKLNEDYNAER